MILDIIKTDSKENISLTQNHQDRTGNLILIGSSSLHPNEKISYRKMVNCSCVNIVKIHPHFHHPEQLCLVRNGRFSSSGVFFVTDTTTQWLQILNYTHLL